MSDIVCTMGRKMGDVLFAMVNARQISRLNKKRVDFITSNYCMPIVSLIQHQSYIDNVFVSKEFTDQCDSEHPETPWNYEGKLPEWKQVYNYGFPRFPDISIPYWYTKGLYTLPDPPWKIEYPDWKITQDKYFVMVPAMRYRNDEVYCDVLNQLPYKTIVLGSPGEELSKPRSDTVQLCGVLDMKQSAAVLARAEAVITPLSSNAILGSLVGAKLVVPFSGLETLKIFGVYSDTVTYVHKPYTYSEEGPSAKDIIKAAMSYAT